MKAKKTLLAVALSAALAVAVALSLILWYAPPLRPAADYSVTYTVSGQLYSDAQLFQPFGMASRRYIFFPSPSAPQYRWLVVDFSRNVAALPLFGVTCPCGSPCIHRDQNLGVLLTDAKIEDTWQVSVTRNAVELSNGTMSVFLAKPKSGSRKD